MAASGTRQAFPPWAPSALVATLISLDQPNIGFSDDGELDDHVYECQIRRRLLTDFRMRSVWGAVHVKRQMDDRLLEQLTTTVIRSLSKFRYGHKLTRAESKEHFNGVADSAKRLARRIGRDLGPKSATLAEHFELFLLNKRLRGTSLNDEQRRIALKEVRKWLNDPVGPSFGEVLQRMAEAATEAAKAQPVLARPKGGGAEGHFLALRLCDFFQRHCGSPLYDHVATIASVATGTEVGREPVRKLYVSRR